METQDTTAKESIVYDAKAFVLMACFLALLIATHTLAYSVQA